MGESDRHVDNTYGYSPCQNGNEELGPAKLLETAGPHQTSECTICEQPLATPNILRAFKLTELVGKAIGAKTRCAKFSDSMCSCTTFA